MYNVRTICVRYMYIVRILHLQYTCHYVVYEPNAIGTVGGIADQFVFTV